MAPLKTATSYTNPTEKSAILFDMDGVLVDVTESYRKAIQETVQFFTGNAVEPSEIQKLKQKGGLNNDWDLTEAILVSRGKPVPKGEIIRKFQEFYLGTKGKEGFIENEKWLLPKEKLVALHKQRNLGIVTGRPLAETRYVLKKFQVKDLFDLIIAMEDYPPEKAKPDPYPIELALEILDTQDVIYIGDSVDDIEAAKRAGIRAMGCIPPGVSQIEKLRELLFERGAEKVLGKIEDIDTCLVLGFICFGYLDWLLFLRGQPPPQMLRLGHSKHFSGAYFLSLTFWQTGWFHIFFQLSLRMLPSGAIV